jgi:predicted PurR-regulated permease PerM
MEELSTNVQKRQMPVPERQEPLAVTPPWSSLILYIPPFLVFFVDAGLVLVLLLFMLIAHRDLHDRLFRLIGYGRVTVTTKALDEAGRRIGRALRMQAEGTISLQNVRALLKDS